MHGLRRERRQTHGNVVRAFRARRAVAHPFTGAGHNGLARVHVEHAAVVFDSQRSGEDQREFVKLRSLARLDPAAVAAHVRNAQSGFAAIHPANELFDDFRLVAGGGDSGWCGNEGWHSVWLLDADDSGVRAAQAFEQIIYARRGPLQMKRKGPFTPFTRRRGHGVRLGAYIDRPAILRFAAIDVSNDILGAVYGGYAGVATGIERLVMRWDNRSASICLKTGNAGFGGCSARFTIISNSSMAKMASSISRR